MVIRRSVALQILQGDTVMKKNDYFGLSRVVSIILAIFLSPICGIITRFMEGNTTAGVIRLVLALTGVGTFVLWVLDLVCIIQNDKIFAFREYI